MIQLLKYVLDYIKLLPQKNCSAFNDTGDGCLHVFWDTERHPLTCIKVASVIN